MRTPRLTPAGLKLGFERGRALLACGEGVDKECPDPKKNFRILAAVLACALTQLRIYTLAQVSRGALLRVRDNILDKLRKSGSAGDV